MWCPSEPTRSSQVWTPSWSRQQPASEGSNELAGQHRVPVDVLVEQVAETARTAGVAGLRAEGAQPHEVALLHLDPVLVQPVDGLALQHVETVLHHVGLRERD